MTYIKKKNAEKVKGDTWQEFESNAADTVQGDMDHIMHALQSLDTLLKQRLFMADDYVTMMDVIMYNELSQVLFMNSLFYKNSLIYQQMQKHVEPSAPDEEIEMAQIRHLDSVVQWYTKSMQVGDNIHLSIKKYDHQLRTMLQQTA